MIETDKKHIKAFYYIFYISLIGLFIKNLLNGYSKESWQITEFLINYQGGFTRRGLLGEVIFKLYTVTGLSPYGAILFISIICYITLVAYFSILFDKKGYDSRFFPFVFFLGNPIINNFVIRKDCLIILIFISVIHLAKKKSIISLILTNIVFSIGILIHESIGFFTFPILYIILLAKNKQKHNNTLNCMLYAFLQLFLSICVFICVLFFKGSESIANQIWDSWNGVSFPIQDVDIISPTAAVYSLSWPLIKGLSYTLRTFLNFNGGIYGPIAWILILLLVYYLVSNTVQCKQSQLQKTSYKVENNHFSEILILQFLTIIPLFILGWDYGRWVFYWVTTSYVIILNFQDIQIINLIPRIVKKITLTLNSLLDHVLNKNHIMSYSLILGVPAYSWNVEMYMLSTSIGVVLKMISLPFKVAFNFIISNYFHDLIQYFPDL